MTAFESSTVLFRAAPDVLSVMVDGYSCGLAPVGDRDGPYRISVVKFTPDDDNPRIVGIIPISRQIARFDEALAALHVGFEILVRGRLKPAT